MIGRVGDRRADPGAGPDSTIFSHRFLVTRSFLFLKVRSRKPRPHTPAAATGATLAEEGFEIFATVSGGRMECESCRQGHIALA